MNHDALANISINSTHQREGNRNRNEGNGISDGELLQSNATVIAGTLIFLTIGSLSEGLVGGTGFILTTALLVIPLSISSGIIISGKKPKVFGSKTLSIIGFVYLAVVVGSLAYSQYQPLPIYTPAEKCAVNPTDYNITHPSDCSKFTLGSLAQDCALHPEKYHLQLKQCSRFITR
jgi:hypothetical protein